MSADVRTRRWDDPRRPGDGLRALVCRYRPRGLGKADETWDVWWKDLSPSVALHAAAYGKEHTAIDWDEYRRRFLVEMAVEPACSRLRDVAGRIRDGEAVTLLCSSACTDETRCHRTILRVLLAAGDEVVTRLHDAAARARHARLTTGRRSVRLWFAASVTSPGVVFLLARDPRAKWLADLRDDPLVELAIDGRTFTGIARVLDGGEAAVARRQVEQKYRQADGAPAGGVSGSAAAVPVAITLLAVR
jgi:uncharacterized protein YeaO (DUF488 family)